MRVVLNSKTIDRGLSPRTGGQTMVKPKYVKVSHSLIAVGAVGVRIPLYLAQQMKGGAHPSPFAALSFPDSKKAPNYCWFNRVFYLSASYECLH